MKTIKKEPYCSPRLEIVPFAEEDILTVSTNESVGTGTAPEYDWNTGLTWT